MGQTIKKCVFATGLLAVLGSSLSVLAAEQQGNISQSQVVSDVVQEESNVSTGSTSVIEEEIPQQEEVAPTDDAVQQDDVDQAVWHAVPSYEEAVIIETQAPQTTSSSETIGQSAIAPQSGQSLWPAAPTHEAVIIEAQAPGQKEQPEATDMSTDIVVDGHDSAAVVPPQTGQSLWPIAPVRNHITSNHTTADEDDIIATIEEAMRQYRIKDFAGAISNLDYAAHLIRQKKSELLKALLPEPFYGWQAKPPASQSLGTAVFGGGSTVSRDYFTQSGSALSIEIVSDSPVLQSIVMMLNNPLFAGASGGNLKTIKQQRAMIKYDDDEHSGEINIVVASRFIVTIKGRNIDITWLFRYAEAIDFEALAKN